MKNKDTSQKAPFFSSLQHLTKQKARFYIPGHKGNPRAIPVFKDVLPYDITEITGADDLSHPQFALAQSQQNMTVLYGSGATLYSANGSTSCIQAMLNLFVEPEQTVILARGCHVSAVRALGFIGAHAKWIYPQNKVPTAKEVATALHENPQAVAVYLTSPDYEGHIADIRAISEICHQYDVALLVDNAHGAHLAFLQENIHPITLGADACADSAHKTLPCLTPAAMLHLKNSALAKQARASLNLFSSTSPSYLVLQSLDLAAKLLSTTPPDFQKPARQLAKVASSLPHLTAKTDDPLKLFLEPAKGGWAAEEINQALEKEGIFAELADSTRLIFMASPYNTQQDFDTLEKALSIFPEKPALPNTKITLEPPKLVCSVRKALFGKKETIATEKATGRTMAGLFAPCPPGVPLVLPGEEISQNAVNLLCSGGILEVDVLK